MISWDFKGINLGWTGWCHNTTQQRTNDSYAHVTAIKAGFKNGKEITEKGPFLHYQKHLWKMVSSFSSIHPNQNRHEMNWKKNVDLDAPWFDFLGDALFCFGREMLHTFPLASRIWHHSLSAFRCHEGLKPLLGGHEFQLAESKWWIMNWSTFFVRASAYHLFGEHHLMNATHIYQLCHWRWCQFLTTIV